MNAILSARRAETPLRRRAASHHDLAFARDVLAGLAAPRKSIPGHWRHDARGVALHQAIERSDAGSPARLERALLASAAAPIAALAGAGARLLALDDDDAPGPALLRAAIERLGAAAARPRAGRRLLFVAGSASATMPCDATTSIRLRDAARQGRHDVLIVAAGALRDPASVVAVDAEGAALKSEFDLNLLVRIRRELGADLDPEGFDRQARFDPRRQCIETTLVSRGSQRACVLGRSFDFADGEPILVSREYQHCLPRFEHLARDAGWSHAQLWVDTNARFAVHVLERT